MGPVPRLIDPVLCLTGRVPRLVGHVPRLVVGYFCVAGACAGRPGRGADHARTPPAPPAPPGRTHARQPIRLARRVRHPLDEALASLSQWLITKAMAPTAHCREASSWARERMM